MYTFSLSSDQTKAFREWKANHNCNINEQLGGAIGGQYTFEFTPTSLGVCTNITCSCCKDKLQLTDYSVW